MVITLKLTSATDPDSILRIFDDRAKVNGVTLHIVDREADQRASVTLRNDQLVQLIAELTRLCQPATTSPSTSGESIVTNVSNLTPHMRGALLRGTADAPRIVTRSTGKALQDRGLVIDVGNGWYRLTDAGTRARTLLEASNATGRC